MDTAFSYLSKRGMLEAPGKDTEWQQQTIYSAEPQDYAITSKLFTANEWSVEVYQGVAPLGSTVYHVTVFNEKLKLYWKGSIRADGSVAEEAAFRRLSEEESQKIAEELSRKRQIPPPRPGGYGH